MAKISVIVPIYKVEKYLQRCIDSIIYQSFTDYELILVDDGSPDISGKKCDELALQLNKAKYLDVIVIHQNNGGLSSARNSGIEWAIRCSISEWIVFIDSDDYIHINYLDNLYKSVVENCSDLAVCDFVRVDDQDNNIDSVHSFPNETINNKEQLFKASFANWRLNVAWNKIYRKSIFNDLRFDYGKIHEDIFIVLSVLFKCERVSFIDSHLYFYLTRDDSITGEETDISKLDTLEADIRRYWFCKENSMPVDPWAVNHERRINVAHLRREVKPENRVRYRILNHEYKKIYLDFNKGLKSRIFYIFGENYEKLSTFIKG